MSAAGALAGKRVLVTGSSRGIGLAAAVEFAALGAHVVMHARDRERGEAARRLVAERTGSDRTELLLADFAHLEQVPAAAEEYLRRHDRLDVLVANAGAIHPRRVVTEHGNELTFQVNHLAHFLLCRLLEPVLLASAPARVVSVSSDAHQAAWRGIRFRDPAFQRGWGPFRAYAHAKLANIMFCYEHARRLAGTGVTSTVMHPGLVRSGFGAEGYGVFGAVMLKVMTPLVGHTPEQGADTLVWLASAAEVKGVSGVYYYHRHPHRSSPASRDVDEQRRLWELSERLCGL